MRFLLTVILLFFFRISFAQNVTINDLLLAAEDSIAQNIFEGAYLKCEEALTLGYSDDDKGGVLRALNLMSEINQRRGRLDKELRVELEILDWYEKNNNKEGVYNSHLELAALYQKQKLYDKSAASYLSAIKYAEEEEEEIYIKEKLCDVYFLDERFPASRRMRAVIVEHYRKRGGVENEMYHRQKMADGWSAQNNHDKVVSEYLKIYDIAENNLDSVNMVTAENNIGIAYTKKKNYQIALEYFKRAEDFCDGKDWVDLSVLFSNIGIAYNNIGDNKKAIIYLDKAKEYTKNSILKADLDHKVAKIYLGDNDLYNAERRIKDAIYSASKVKGGEVLSNVLETGAEIEKRLYNFEGAFNMYKEHLKLARVFLLEEEKETQRLLEIKTQLEQSEKETRLELASREIEANRLKGEKERLAFEKATLELEKRNIALEKARKEKENALLEQKRKAQEAELATQAAELKNKELETEALRKQKEQELVLAQQRLDAEKKARELEESKRQQALQRLEIKASQDSILLKEQKLLAAEEKERNKQKLLEKQQAVSNLNRIVAFVVGSLSLLIIGLVLWFLRLSNRKNKELANKNEKIEKQKIELEESRDLIVEEQEKSEKLLLNILPAPIAAELKEVGMATPQVYEQVSILFTDFAGFTKVSYEMSADELIDDLNTCFVAFDEIVEKYGMEKIKTIGDSYMCAGGVPIPLSVPPSDVVRAALEMQEFMKKRLVDKEKAEQDYWGTRIGIHTGIVVAGVVGKNKFAYDIWGNAVNVASRMESNAEVNSINVSEETYQLIKDDFECEYRGEFHVKNKGMMKMYKVIEARE